ncbi:MAG: hypothetical protein ACYDCP_03445 [Thermoplasmataceae archaeon]
MNDLDIVKATFLRELKTIRRSNIHLIILVADALLSMVSAEVIFLNFNYSSIVFQAVLIIFFTEFFSFFVILLISPSLTITEERELGTWNILRSHQNDLTPVKLGKVIFQMFYSIFMILIAVLSLIFIYIVNYGFHFTSSLTVTRSFKTVLNTYYPGGVFTLPQTEHINSIVKFSLYTSFQVIGVAIIVAFLMTFIGLCISRISGNRTFSIVLSIFVFVIFTALYSISTNSIGPLTKIKTVLISANPSFLFPLVGDITGLKTIVYPITDGTYTLSVSSPYYGAFNYTVILVILFLIFIAILFFPEFAEVKKWKRNTR